MNISNVKLNTNFQNTVPLSLPEGITIDVSQITGIVPIAQGGTNATNINDAAMNLGVLRKNALHLANNSMINRISINGQSPYDKSVVVMFTDTMYSTLVLDDDGATYLVTSEYGDILNGGKWDEDNSVGLYMYTDKAVSSLSDSIRFKKNGVSHNLYGGHNMAKHYHNHTLKMYDDKGYHVFDVLKLYDDGDGEDKIYGAELIVSGGGNVYVGAGESAQSCYNHNDNNHSLEELYLCADNSAYIMTRMSSYNDNPSAGIVFKFLSSGYAQFPSNTLYTTYQVHNQAFNTGAMTSGTTSLTNNYIYNQYS